MKTETSLTPNVVADNVLEAFNLWLVRMRVTHSATDIAKFERAFSETHANFAEQITDTGEKWTVRVLSVASILADLNLDSDAIIAALLLPNAGLPHWAERRATFCEQYGEDVPVLIDGTWRMRDIALLPQGVDAEERGRQAEHLRKMLLAMVEDIRVVLIKLAERLQAIRQAAQMPESDARLQIAREVSELFAPLANRLGIWQVKWELEDLSLRILEPSEYRRIANLLDERQIDRLRYIENVINTLKEELDRAQVKADVTGRPKHIYSIWNKMRRKQTSIDALYDIRAVRILVDDIKDCYTALGIVHNLWTPLPREFDDYIAKPKANQYRSLHTAVMGPEDKSVEVQIRTWDMHRHSEYGVAAHWRYKEKSYAQNAVAKQSAPVKNDAGFEQKIAWLRQILEWKDLIADDNEVLSAFKSSLFTDTIYVLTPQGKVIDLPAGATPLDFAYSLHTNLGHRCRGARVNGQMVPLNATLKNGQRVEIVAAKQGGPSRDWLNIELRYVISHRARSKIRQWFKQQQLDETIAQGRAIVEKELARMGATVVKLETLATQAGFAKTEELFMAAGRDEITARQLQQTIQGLIKPGTLSTAPAPEEDLAAQIHAVTETPHQSRAQRGDILIVGVDRLMTNLARCCKPAPPDPIIGFVTRGKGVSIHRVNCENLIRAQSTSPERMIEANWGDTKESLFPVDIVVEATERPGLLRDLSEVFSRDRVRLISASMQSKHQEAKLYFTIEVQNLTQLNHTLTEARNVAGVFNVAR